MFVVIVKSMGSKKGFDMREIRRRNTPSIRERLLKNKTISAYTGCWEWGLCISSGGYGIIGVNQKARLAHRISYQEFVGEIADGMCVLHKCDNRKCINPEHLFLGTKGDNADDRKRKGRCAKGEGNGGAKLSESDVRYIRQSEQSAKDLSILFDVHVSAIYKIRSGIYWGWLK